MAGMSWSIRRCRRTAASSSIIPDPSRAGVACSKLPGGGAVRDQRTETGVTWVVRNEPGRAVPREQVPQARRGPGNWRAAPVVHTLSGSDFRSRSPPTSPGRPRRVRSPRRARRASDRRARAGRLLVPACGGGRAAGAAVRPHAGPRLRPRPAPTTRRLSATRRGAGTPVVVFIYGGRWQGGSKEQYRLLGDALTREGFVAVMPDYRLYPEVGFPRWVEDGARAVRWVRDSIARYGGDPGPNRGGGSLGRRVHRGPARARPEVAPGGRRAAGAVRGVRGARRVRWPPRGPIATCRHSWGPEPVGPRPTQ